MTTPRHLWKNSASQHPWPGRLQHLTPPTVSGYGNSSLELFSENRKLLDSFRSGQDDALSRVYWAYVDDVAALVRGGFLLRTESGARIPGAHNAELERELVQETFLRAFAEKARDAYDGLRPYRPYLLQIARNLLIDDYRKQARRPLQVPIEAADQQESEALPAEERLAWQQLRQATLAFLATQTEEIRKFAQMRFEEDLSQYQLMDQLGWSRWRVRATEKKLLQTLKKHLIKQSLIKK